MCKKCTIANSDKPVKFYSLDIVLAVGYRTNSSKAIKFRQWSTKVLKEHIVQGYTINKERLQKNYDEFLRVVEDIKVLSQNANNVKAEDVLELIKAFSATWFGLGIPTYNTRSQILTIKSV